MTESQPTTIQITVELGELLNRYRNDDERFEPMSLADALLHVAAQRLVEKLPRDVTSDLVNRARNIGDELLREAIQPLITTAVDGAVQPTNRWGEPTGEAMTLAEAITKQVDHYLTKQVDSGYGKPTRTMIQKFIYEEVERKVSSELREAMETAKAEVKAAVQAEGAKIIAETIARTAGVR